MLNKKPVEFGVKTALCLADVNIVRHCHQELEQVLESGVDLLFCNQAQATLYAATEDVEQALSYLGQWAKTILLTTDDGEVIIADHDARCHIPAHQVCVVDAMGADSVFVGSYLYGICQGVAPKTAGEIAAFAAAEVMTKFGPRLDSSTVQQVTARIRHAASVQEPVCV